jgi:hypothetical protein
MGTDGVVHGSAEPFKQRVARSIRARLTRMWRQLGDLPPASHCRLRFVVSGAGSGAGCASRSGARQTLNSVELVSRGEVRIALGHRQCLVAHQILHGSDIDPAHHQPRRERVPQVVPPEVSDASPLQCRREDAVDEVLRVEWRLARLGGGRPKGWSAARAGRVALLAARRSSALGSPRQTSCGERSQTPCEVHVRPAKAKLVCLAEAGVEGDSDLGPVALPDFAT